MPLGAISERKNLVNRIYTISDDEIITLKIDVKLKILIGLFMVDIMPLIAWVYKSK